jgi:hypothetical protein
MISCYRQKCLLCCLALLHGSCASDATEEEVLIGWKGEVAERAQQVASKEPWYV